MNINRTIIVPTTLAQRARTIAAGIAAGGIGMFETAVKTGASITHYVSSGQIDALFDSVLPLEGSSQAAKDAAANAMYAACQAAEPPVNVTLAQCQELISQSIVVDCDVESAQETFARLGVTL